MILATSAAQFPIINLVKYKFLVYLTQWLYSYKTFLKKDGVSNTQCLIRAHQKNPSFSVAISAEGTRKRIETWRTGWWYIVKETKLPVLLVGLDFKNKTVVLDQFMEMDEKDTYEKVLPLVQERLKRYQPHTPSNCSLFDVTA